MAKKELCEASIARTPNSILAEGGFMTSLSCQRCERQIDEVAFRARDDWSFEQERKFVLFWLGKCPELLSKGFKVGAIPLDRLPEIKEVGPNS